MKSLYKNNINVVQTGLIVLAIGIFVYTVEFYFTNNLPFNHSYNEFPRFGWFFIGLGVFDLFLIVYPLGGFSQYLERIKIRGSEEDVEKEIKKIHSRNKIIVITIAIGLCVYGYVWYTIPEYRTYTGFGISVDYRNRMDIGEKGISDEEPISADYGQVLFSLDGERISFNWGKNPIYDDLDKILDYSVDNLYNNFNVLKEGDRNCTSVNSEPVIIQAFTLTYDSRYRRVYIGTWIHYENDTLYNIFYYTKQNDGLDSFMYFLNSIKYIS